eukprot:CAMPEP_0113596960 /NCGR_PEP_ID=MMETSP0015_2-20120614/40672_1 /TAXON_ID=2838 /ORGANISM="Odontella" /LENGTH=385 /DNA_ID=CAMNT_0000504625 /DNA_START=286 /DNA_END=1444 /DNA_ORIENTATION=- /assembly_acc=CAM_ASM_000160
MTQRKQEINPEVKRHWDALELLYFTLSSFATFAIVVDVTPKCYVLALGPPCAMALGICWYKNFGPTLSIAATLAMSTTLAAVVNTTGEDDPLLEGLALLAEFTGQYQGEDDPLLEGLVLLAEFTRRLLTAPSVTLLFLLAVTCAFSLIPKTRNTHAANRVFAICYACIFILGIAQLYTELQEFGGRNSGCEALATVACHQSLWNIILYACLGVRGQWQKEKGSSVASLKDGTPDKEKIGEADSPTVRIATRERLFVYFGTLSLFVFDFSSSLKDGTPDKEKIGEADLPTVRIATRERLFVYFGTLSLFVFDFSKILFDGVILPLLSLTTLIGLTFVLGGYFWERVAASWRRQQTQLVPERDDELIDNIKPTSKGVCSSPEVWHIV